MVPSQNVSNKLPFSLHKFPEERMSQVFIIKTKVNYTWSTKCWRLLKLAMLFYLLHVSLVQNSLTVR